MNVPNVLASRAVFTGVRTLSGPGAEPKRRGGAVAPSHFTVLGAAGFVGSALVAALQCAGHRVRPVTRGTLPALLETHRDAGHVIDCIGLTGDFRTRPHETAEAHVGVTARCLAGLHFESFLFLSSTRVYARADATQEDAPLPCVPADPSDLYNLTKLAEGHAAGAVRFRQSAKSSKDYVSLAEVTRLLPAIAAGGRYRLYNLAAGMNTSHAAVAVALRRRFGWHVDFAPGAPTVRFPRIDTTRLAVEFGAALSNLSADLATLAADGQEVQCSPSMSEAVG